MDQLITNLRLTLVVALLLSAFEVLAAKVRNEQTEGANVTILTGVLLIILSSSVYAQDQVDREMMEAVNEMNQLMPMNVGNGLVALNMGYIPGSRIVVTTYRFESATVEQIRAFGIEALKAQGKQALVRMNCTSEPNGEFIRQEGLRMKYIYFDKNHNQIYDIWVTKEDCDGL